MYFGSVESDSASKTGSSMLDLPVQDEVPEFGDTVKTYMEQTKNLGYGIKKRSYLSTFSD